MRQQNIKQKRFRLSWSVLAVAGVLVVLTAATVWHVWIRPDNKVLSPAERLQSDNINYDPPTPAEKKEAEQQKEDIINEPEKDPEPPTDASLVATIVSTFQDPAGLNIRTLVNGTTDGNCELSLTRSGQTAIVKTVPVVFEATSAHCQNTPIPLSEFPVGGTWQLAVTVQKNSAQSAPATLNVDIKK
jgi:hypothetical protein